MERKNMYRIFTWCTENGWTLYRIIDSHVEANPFMERSFDEPERFMVIAWGA